MPPSTRAPGRTIGPPAVHGRHTEARGGPLGDDLSGEERLRAALAEGAGSPAEAVVERVRIPASQWAGTGRHDDMAAVASTAPRTARLGAVDRHTWGRCTA
ncbi:hypothetical protein GCM10023082_39790 [Streptomyces tremellae]|uniref:Uncharacterized protein n=1 Tax=Streptomyces tremellae TaxID=1124239 RepID=A0ABP7FFY7_9ACTN